MSPFLRSSLFLQYTKAKNAIMGIDFEINLDNAKKLAKAGKNGMKVGKNNSQASKNWNQR